MVRTTEATTDQHWWQVAGGIVKDIATAGLLLVAVVIAILVSGVLAKGGRS
jgi:hypothetical protein